MRNISPVKQRILQYIDYKNVSKYKFYQESDITRGVLDKENGISEENVAKFIAYATDVSIDWLLTGRGNMLRDPAQTIGVNSEDSSNINSNFNNSKDCNNGGIDGKEVFTSIKEQILEKDKQLAEKDKQINNLLDQQSKFLEQIDKLVDQQSKLVDQQSKLISKL